MDINTRKLTFQYCVIQACYWGSCSTIYGFAVVFLSSRGYESSNIGIIIAAASIFGFSLQPVLAGIADSGKCFDFLAVCKISFVMLLGFLAVMGFWQKDGYLSAFIFFLVLGVIWAVQPLVNAISIYYVNRGISLDFGSTRACGSISYSIISLMIGGLISRFNVRVIPFTALILTGVCTITLWRLPHVENSDVKTEIKQIYSTKGSVFFKKYTSFSVMLLAILCMYIFHNFTGNYMIYFLEQMGGDSGNLGISNAIAAMSELITLFGFAFWVRKISSKKMLVIAGGFFIAKGIGYLLARNVMTIYMVQLLQIGSFALLTGASVHYTNEEMEAGDKYKGQAYMSGMNAMGCVIGSFTGGFILSFKGVRSLYAFALIIGIIGFILSIISLRMRRAYQCES